MNGPAKSRILLVDDHQLVRSGLRALIERQPGLKVVGEEAPEDLLVLRGKATLLGREASVKAVFDLEGGDLARYYLLASMPGDWKLPQSLVLPSFFGSFKLKKPLLVLTAKKNVITDDEYRLEEETFDNGLDLYAAGLTASLPLGELVKYRVEDLPGFGPVLDGTPYAVKGRRIDPPSGEEGQRPSGSRALLRRARTPARRSGGRS